MEAEGAGVPCWVLPADRPPELGGTGANQTIDQLRLYGPAVRWFCEVGVAEERTGQDGYWRSAACRAWGLASGSAGGVPGPVHLNLAMREPLVPDAPFADGPPSAADEPRGRPDGAPWTRFGAAAELPWAERGLVVCGDGDYDPAPLLSLADQAGWPVLAEPSSNARCGPCALGAYQYLLADPGFVAAHQPDVIVSAGRPGLSRGQLGLLRSAGLGRPVVIAPGAGPGSDPPRSPAPRAATGRPGR